MDDVNGPPPLPEQQPPLHSSAPAGDVAARDVEADTLPEDDPTENPPLDDRLTERMPPVGTASSTARADDAVGAVGGVGRAAASWAGLLVSLGLGLATVQALYFIFSLAQGLSLRKSGAGGLPGDFLHRVGIALSRSLSPIQGLALVLCVALVSIPAVVNMRLPARYERRRLATLYVVAVVAVLIGIGSALGVRAELHLDQVQGTATTPFRRWSLATDVVGTLGTALVAFLAALAAFPDRRRSTQS